MDALKEGDESRDDLVKTTQAHSYDCMMHYQQSNKSLLLTVSPQAVRLTASSHGY
jgi:hypothetical protein